MKELAVFIDNNSTVPAYEQIYMYIREEIKNGRLKCGDSLPSSRALAEYLQFSRSTILMAYDQLVAEGYIESVPQKGYYVMQMDGDFNDEAVSGTEHDSHCDKDRSYDIVFSPDGIETAKFPYAEWRRISRQLFEPENGELFNSGDAQGDEGLREVVADYLMKSRGVRADATHIILGSGNENLLMIINMILDRNAVFAMENPAYMKSYRLVNGMGREIIPVSMDEDGMKIDELDKSGATIAYVTPSHQYPMGTIMGIRRRLELIAWAKKSENSYIIEDDYDSEFRYKGKPIPALQGNDDSGKVIYIGTFSKSISPAIRISYMVLPEDLYVRYLQIKQFCSNTVSRIDQKVVEIFIRNGGYERHLNRMRKIYKLKHDFMLGELREWKNTAVSGENSGAHMILKIDNGMSGRELVSTAADNGIKIYPLADYYIDGRDYDIPSVLLGYARLDESDIKKGLGILKKIWKL